MKKLLLFLILLWLLPIWCFSFLPFVDLPQHLAIAHIVHNYQNPEAFDYSQFFSLKWFPKAGILHTLFLHWMSFFVPLEIAGKLFISLIVILLPVSIYLFIKALGGNRWFSLFSFFFIYNYNLMWGFIAYCLGISLFFFFFSLLLKLSDEQKDVLKINLSIALLLLLAVLAHVYIYLLLLIPFLVILCYFHKRNWQKIRKGLLLALASIVLFLFCIYPVWLQKKGLLLKLVPTFLPSLSSIQRRCLNLPRYLFFGRPFDKVFFWFILGVFFSLFILQLIQATRDRKCGVDRKCKVVYLVTLVFIALYLSVPTNIVGLHSNVGPRLAIFIPLLLIGPLSKVRLRRLTSLLVLTSVVLALLFAILVRGFHKFDVQAKPVRTLLQKTDKNKRLVELYTYPQASPFYFHSFAHFSCYYIIWKDGLCEFFFPQADKHHIVGLKQRVNLPWVNVFNSWESIFPKGFENFDYFLVCGKPSSENEQRLKESGGLHLLGQEGIWRLYESRERR